MNDSRSFYYIIAAALLYGTAAGQMTMIAPMLQQMALTPAAIGLVLAAVPAGNIAGRMCSGWIVEKIGPRRALCISSSAAAVGIAGLLVIISVPPLFILTIAVVAAAIRGLSYSVFNTAGICEIRTRASSGQRVYAVGMFTAMFMASNLWAPAISEFTLLHYGMIIYLVFATTPMLLATVLVAYVKDNSMIALEQASRYMTLLRDRRLWLPELIIFCSGLSYGFSTGVLPLFLLHSHIGVTSYFTSFGVALMVNRLLLLRSLQKLPPPVVAVYGLVMSIASICGLLIRVDTIGTIIAGILFGLGYLLHPATVEWSLRFYQHETVRPVALLNITLGLGQIVSTQIGGSLFFLGSATLLKFLCVPLLFTLAIVMVVSFGRNTRQAEGLQER